MAGWVDAHRPRHRHVRFVRALTDAYRRPTGSIHHLSVTGRTLGRAARRLPASGLDFQEHVIDSGDFFATWAVELAVHHLDLGLELIMEPPTPAPLALTRRTVEELAGGALAADLDDVGATLICTGRLPVPATIRSLDLNLPAFG